MEGQNSIELEDEDIAILTETDPVRPADKDDEMGLKDILFRLDNALNTQKGRAAVDEIRSAPT